MIRGKQKRGISFSLIIMFFLVFSNAPAIAELTNQIENEETISIDIVEDENENTETERKEIINEDNKEEEILETVGDNETDDDFINSIMPLPYIEEMEVNALIETFTITSVAFAGGTGTENDPYQISTPQQLDAVRNDLSAHYILVNDIDLGIWGDWEPIGSSDINAFKGIFNGNNFSIKNMTINNTPPVYAGLFGIILTNATIKNVNMAYTNINISPDGAYYVGGIVGSVGYPGLGIIIENCSNSGVVSVSRESSAYVGGIVGYCPYNSSMIIKNCTNSGNISAFSFNEGNTFAGGIVGYSSQNSTNSIIENCANSGDISASSLLSNKNNQHWPYYSIAGGIVGNVYASERAFFINSITIKNCANTGNVSAYIDEDYVYGSYGTAIAGGVVGRIASYGGSGDYTIQLSTIIENCSNSKTVRAISNFSYAGGLVGFVTYCSTLIFKPYCYYPNHLPVIGDISDLAIIEGLEYAIPQDGGGSSPSLKMDITTKDMKVGDIFFLIAYLDNANINWSDVDSTSCTWTSSNPSVVGLDLKKVAEVNSRFYKDTLQTGNKGSSSIQIEALSPGVSVITVKLNNGSSVSCVVTVSSVEEGNGDENHNKNAGEFIRDNCQLIYSPIINDNTYYHYEINDYIVNYDSGVFSLKPDSGRINSYLLDDNYSLVSEPRTIVKAAYLTVINDVRAGSDYYDISKLEEELQIVLGIENSYQESLDAYKWGDTLVQSGDFIFDVAIMVAKTGSGDATAPASFLSKLAFNTTKDWAKDTVTTTARTKDILREITRNQHYDTTHHYQTAISRLKDSSCFDAGNNGKGYLRNYDDAVTLNKSKYLMEIYFEWAKVDFKYLANEIDSAIGKGALDHILKKFYGAITGYLGSEIEAIKTFNKFVDFTIAVKDSMTLVTGDIRTMRDPDLVNLFNTVEVKSKHFQESLFPVYNIDAFDNLRLIATLNGKQTSDINELIFIGCPVDINVYNQNDEIIGKVIDNLIDKTIAFDSEHPLIIDTIGDCKVLMFNKNDNFKIDILATDFGIMFYRAIEIVESGNKLSDTSIYNISLDKGKQFSVNGNIQGTKGIDYTRLISQGEIITFKINLITSQNGTVIGEGDYEKGSIIQLIAKPNNGYTFNGWYENGSKISNTGKYYSFSVTADRTLEARFYQKSSSNNSSVSSSSSGSSSSNTNNISTDDENLTSNENLDIEKTQQEAEGRSKLSLDKTSRAPYILGYPDGTIHPENNITRAEVTTIFYNLISDTNKSGYKQIATKFKDITDDKWYSEAVRYLTNMKVLSGYEDGTFKPDNEITRAEFVTIASNFAELNLSNSLIFSDVPKNYWAYNFIQSAYNYGWVFGYPDGLFQPERKINRAETIVIINKILERTNLDGSLYENPFSDLQATAWYYDDVLSASIVY